jgi:hypothetical protein
LRFEKAGFPRTRAPEEVIRAAWGNQDADENDLWCVFSCLEEAGWLFGFDVETSTFPNRHDELLKDLSAHTKGVLEIECATEEFKGDGRNPHYVVAFLVGDTVFRYKARAFGDWYDAEFTLKAFNDCLKHFNMKERFVELSCDGQYASYLFGRPDIVTGLCDELMIPLAATRAEAMKKGKEYEKKALEFLRSGVREE